MIVEVEVDTLRQLDEVLAAGTGMVLLDDLAPAELRQAVAAQRLAPGVELEASGGVDLSSVGRIAETGVERISVGALTHSAPRWTSVWTGWGLAGIRMASRPVHSGGTVIIAAKAEQAAGLIPAGPGQRRRKTVRLNPTAGSLKTVWSRCCRGSPLRRIGNVGGPYFRAFSP